jgi:hypothetical protein
MCPSQGQGSWRFRSQFFSLAAPPPPLDRQLPGPDFQKAPLSTTDSGFAPGLELVPLTFGRVLHLLSVSTPRLLCHQGSRVFLLGTQLAVHFQLTHPRAGQLRSRTEFSSPFRPHTSRLASHAQPYPSSLDKATASSQTCSPPVPLRLGPAPAAPSAGCRPDLAPSPFPPLSAARGHSRPLPPDPPTSAPGV